MKHCSFLLPVLVFAGMASETPQSPIPLLPQVRTPQRKSCLVTIFIHGTLKPAEISLSTIAKVMRSKIENTLYSLSISTMRANPKLHRTSATQGIGLLPINPAEGVCSSGAQTIRELFELEHAFYENQPTNRLYYTFGWSGLLNAEARYNDAQALYHALEKEIAHLRSQNFEPRIHVIGYSHGGNVALNLAKVKQQGATSAPFVVEKLVLLATPIQKETDHLVSDTEFFKKVYSFYSTEDNVQTSDFFSTRKEFFSGSRFVERSTFKLPPTLTQVRFRVTRQVRRSRRLQDENTQPAEILSKSHIRCSHMDPGHAEFWSLQWGSYWYRPSFPLSPLPVVAFLPAILYLLEHFAPDARKITFDYCPLAQGARLIHRKNRHAVTFPVLTEELTTHMKHVVKTCTPDDFSFEEQAEHEREALRQAHEALKKDRRLPRKKLKTSYFELTRKMWPYQLPQL